MELRTLGSSGVSISRVGLGGFELGPETDEEPNIDRAVHVIETAVESRINWLDTSENYLETRNESLIGAALDRIDADFLLAMPGSCGRSGCPTTTWKTSSAVTDNAPLTSFKTGCP